MHFKVVIALCGLLSFAAANPPSSHCNAPGNKQVCCVGLLPCLVQILGSTCKGQAYCCATDQSVDSIVNINALNCVQIL
jgi:hypothetical protein